MTLPVASRLLPVSILTGPSAPALLRQIIESNPNGFVVLEETSADLAQMSQQIVEVAARPAVQHLIIECDSKTHPIAFASLFLPGAHRDQSFTEVSRLNSIVLAIEPASLVNSIVLGNGAAGVSSPCILADQIECADSVVFVGESDKNMFALARAVLSALNPRAKVFENARTVAPSEFLETTMPFDFEAAFAGAGWRQLMDVKSEIRRADQGVATFLYRARRPFHPERFWNVLQSPFPGIFRAKGFFWLATRMELVGGLNIADSERHCSPAGEWWAAVASADSLDPSEIPDRIKSEWTEPFGDRRQAIALMGIEADFAEITAQLDRCLLSEAEMEAGEKTWATLPDPFPQWSMGHHHHDHDHDCGDDHDHDCCHH